MTKTHLRASVAVALFGAVIVIGGDAVAADPPAAAKAPKPSDVFKRYDKNADGSLRDAEIPRGWIQRFDANGDGRIARKEFLGIMKRPKLLRRLHPMRDAQPRAANAMRQFDRNKDGVVALDEYPGDKHIFRGADRDKSGTLTLKELVRLAKDELDDIRRRMKSPGRRDFLTLFDINRDRKITADEYDGPTRAFKKYDDDRDGTVSYGELYPDEAMRMMEYAEANKPKPEDLTILRAMDTDGDGKVSRKEFKGTAAAWKRLDRNTDGWITTADSQ